MIYRGNSSAGDKGGKIMDRLFELKERGTTVRTEILAGMTTFLTMAYIVVVNPAILEQAGMDFGAVFVATVFASVIATLIMGLFANYPIAIAPGMGLNAYFACITVGQTGVRGEPAMAAVVVAGVIFLLLSVTPLREGLIRSIPDSLKHGITAGIGLFIAFIGLKSAGVIVGDKVNLVGLGDLHDPMTLLSLAGLFVTLVLMTLGVRGAL